MKPILRKIDPGTDYSFSIREDIHPYLYNHWHYHPEIELTLIRKGDGIRLVGDSMQPFEDGDLILLGANVPHLWRSAANYFDQSSDLTIEAILRSRVERSTQERTQVMPVVYGIEFTDADEERRLLLYAYVFSQIADDYTPTP